MPDRYVKNHDTRYAIFPLGEFPFGWRKTRDYIDLNGEADSMLSNRRRSLDADKFHKIGGRCEFEVRFTLHISQVSTVNKSDTIGIASLGNADGKTGRYASVSAPFPGVLRMGSSRLLIGGDVHILSDSRGQSRAPATRERDLVNRSKGLAVVPSRPPWQGTGTSGAAHLRTDSFETGAAREDVCR
jgi:hypothetical protein